MIYGIFLNLGILESLGFRVSFRGLQAPDYMGLKSVLVYL